MQGRAHGCSAGVTKRPARRIAGRQNRPRRMPKTRSRASQPTKITARNRSWWPWGAQGRSGDASGHVRDAPKSAQSAILGTTKTILGGKLGILGATMVLLGSKVVVLDVRRSAGAHCDDFRSISVCRTQAPKCRNRSSCQCFVDFGRLARELRK